MKSLFALLALFTASAYAGLPPTSMKALDGTRATTFNFQVPFHQASKVSGATQLIETGNKNLLSNPGFEADPNAATIQGWTAVNGGTFSVQVSPSSSIGTGKGSGFYNAGGATQYLANTAYTVPAGLFSTNGYASCNVKCVSGGCTHTLQVHDGTNVLASASLVSSTTFAKTGLNFLFPSSGTVQLRIQSVAADEPAIDVDDCYLGEAPNVAQVSQAFVAGSLNWAPTASCSWTTTAAFADFSADSDCPTPTATGFLSAPGTKVPHVDYLSAPPGRFVVTFTGTQAGGVSGSNACDFRLIDDAGTTPVQVRQSMNGGGSGFSLTGEFVYTGSASRTFRIQASATSGNTCSLDNDAGTRSNFTIKVFPGASSIAVQPDQTAMSWSGYHGSGCAWTVTQTTYSADYADDASGCTLTETENNNFGSVVTFGAAKPGITLTPKKAGTYWVCAQPSAFVDTAAVDSAVQLTDGTKVIAEAPLRRAAAGGEIYKRIPLCGSYSVASNASVTLKLQGKSASNATLVDSGAYTRTIDWTIFDISQVGQVQLQNQVSTDRSGGDRIASVCVGGNAACTTNCTSDPCTLARNSGTVTAVNWASTGQYTVTFAAGKFSQAPNCSAQSMDNDHFVLLNSGVTATSLGVTVKTVAGSPAVADGKFMLNCMGAK